MAAGRTVTPITSRDLFTAHPNRRSQRFDAVLESRGPMVHDAFADVLRRIYRVAAGTQIAANWRLIKRS